MDLNSLLENPLPILAVGAILATLTGLVFFSRRDVPSLIAFAMVVVVSLLLLVAEQLVVTDREQVEQALDDLLAAVRSNDVPRVVALIDPAATAVRSDAETLMPMVDVEDTGATSVEIDVDASGAATSRCRGRLRGVHRKSGQAVFFLDDVEFQWIRRGEQWLLAGFTAYWKGKPLNAVNSMKGNRPAPAIR